MDNATILESNNADDISRVDNHIAKTQSLIQEAKDRIKELDRVISDGHGSTSEDIRKSVQIAKEHKEMYNSLLKKDQEELSALEKRKHELTLSQQG